MKKITCVLCLLISCHLYSQTLSVVQLKEAFDTLRNALEEAHGGLYRYYPKSKIDHHFDQYRKELKQPMSQHAFYGFLSKLLAEIGDGHMRVDYDEARMAVLPKQRLFPFRVMVDKDRMTIISNDTKQDSTLRPGMVVLSINGHSIQALKRIILPCLRRDGYIESGKVASFERNFSQNYRLFVDTASVFHIKAKDTVGRTITVSLQGVINSERESNRNQNPVNAQVLSLTKQLEGPADNMSLRFINDSIANLRIRFFVGERFTSEIDSLFALMLKKNTKALILDLRGNGGGIDRLAAYLLSKFMSKPFRYLDSVHTRTLIPSFAEWKQKPPVDLVNGTVPDAGGGYLLKPMLNSCLEEQPPAEHPFTGKLVVLINGKTFSAASDFSALLSHLTTAIFVGEETGGCYQGNTSGLNTILKLPYTKFNVNIHLWDYWNAVPTPAIKGRGVIPDHTVALKTADWLKGIDTQWAFALTLCTSTEKYH